MECPEERLRRGAAPGRPPRPCGGAPILDHSEGKPAGYPVTSMSSSQWERGDCRLPKVSFIDCVKTSPEAQGSTDADSLKLYIKRCLICDIFLFSFLH